MHVRSTYPRHELIFLDESMRDTKLGAKDDTEKLLLFSQHLRSFGAMLCRPTPGLRNKIPPHKIFARVWVAQKSFLFIGSG